MINRRRLIETCLRKREWKKGDVWDMTVRQTRSSRTLRAHSDQELILHEVDFYTCSVCGLHSENGMISVAHIISAESFNTETNLGVINHVHNLLPLCLNCHRKNDSNRHDKEWTIHRLRVLNSLKHHVQSVNYLQGNVIYECPINLTKLYNHVKNVTLYETFFNCGDLIIPNTGEGYKMSPERLISHRKMTLEEATNDNNTNGSPYFTTRQHAKAEALFHGMYNDMKCLICSEKMCDLSHANGIADFDRNTPLGIVNHPHNLIWLCPNHNHTLDNPQFKTEHEEFVQLLDARLINHRSKYTQIPLENNSYFFNRHSINNWRIVEYR